MQIQYYNCILLSKLILLDDDVTYQLHENKQKELIYKLQVIPDEVDMLLQQLV